MSHFFLPGFNESEIQLWTREVPCAEGVEGSFYLSCLPGLHQKHLYYLPWNFSIKQSSKYDLLCALLRREWGKGGSKKFTQWMNLGSDFGFESSLCTFKVLVWLLGWVNVLVRCWFPPEYPHGKTHGCFKPLGSENTSRYQQCKGWTILCHNKKNFIQLGWDGTSISNLGCSISKLRKNPGKKKSSDFPRLT